MYTIIKILLVLVFAFLDIFSKIWMIGYLKTMHGYTKTITWFFDLVYTWNYGMSFGLFHEYHKYSNIALTVLNLTIVLYICHLLLISRSRLEIFGYSLITGGALGNLYDRVVNGAVFDFLYFHCHEYHFPVFNLADSFVCIGVVLLVWRHFIKR
jgi:signal peptidase II